MLMQLEEVWRGKQRPFGKKNRLGKKIMALLPFEVELIATQVAHTWMRVLLQE